MHRPSPPSQLFLLRTRAAGGISSSNSSSSSSSRKKTTQRSSSSCSLSRLLALVVSTTVVAAALLLLLSLPSPSITVHAFLFPTGTALALRPALLFRGAGRLQWTATAAAAAAFWQQRGVSIVVAAQPPGSGDNTNNHTGGDNAVRSLFSDTAARRQKQQEEAAAAAAKEAKARAAEEEEDPEDEARKIAASRAAMAAARGDVNVLGGALELCGTDPMTGFTREGCCTTGPQDFGSHTVCAVVTDAFLSYSRARGNDLMTPRPEFRFPGLKQGDRWCLCASRWQEALEAGVAPQVVLKATHRKALEVCALEDLVAHAIDGPAANTAAAAQAANEGTGAKEEL